MYELLGIGLQLTVWGMGLVFLLLAALWGLMVLLVRIDNPPAADKVVKSSPVDLSARLEGDKVAAITLAVLMHRQVRRKQAAPFMRSHWPGSLPSNWVGAGRAFQNQSWHPHRR